MSDFEKENLEKLEQEQSINRILSKNQLEIEALIEAVQQNINSSPKNIQKKKEKILNLKLKQQEEEYAKQLEERKDFLNYIEEILDNEEPGTIVNQILENIHSDTTTKKISQTQKAREKLEAIERENFRKKYNEKIFKKRSLLRQINLIEKKESYQSDSSDTLPAGHISKDDTTVKNNNPKTTILKKEEIFSILSSDKKPSAINDNSELEQPKRTILSFKMLKATKVYQHNMDFYYESSIKDKNNVVIEEVKNCATQDARERFTKTLHASVNHSEANEKAKKQTSRFEQRTL